MIEAVVVANIEWNRELLSFMIASISLITPIQFKNTHKSLN